MADVAEILHRLEVLEREGSVAALARLDARVTGIQQKQDGHSTALVKIIEILEETRLRVSAVEVELSGLRDEVRAVKADVSGLRRDLPAMLVDAVRAGRQQP